MDDSNTLEPLTPASLPNGEFHSEFACEVARDARVLRLLCPDSDYRSSGETGEEPPMEPPILGYKIRGRAERLIAREQSLRQDPDLDAGNQRYPRQVPSAVHLQRIQSA
eukprot:TRINITY_DN8371_c0_g1_i1.p2 TRINITY_DN8371_c0_g1~~TRINITY_DN8371_c0_g1_i1.p2  ORF type:complete len:109 (-),score=11.86 TRINITY_DN8371_c0_g1_i1:491-817(-)